MEITKQSLRECYPQYQFGKGICGIIPRVRARDDGATLRMDNFISIGTGVQILLGGEHRMDWATTYPFNIFWKEGEHISGHPRTKGDVIIGSDVWIGTEVIILSGVTIGDGAVIGARAVVTKNVPPYTVVAGNPSKVIKKRFDDQTIKRLLDVKWWLWPDSRIARAIPLLLSNDIARFLDYAEAGDNDLDGDELVCNTDSFDSLSGKHE